MVKRWHCMRRCTLMSRFSCRGYRSKNESKGKLFPWATAAMDSLDWLLFNYLNLKREKRRAAVRTSRNSGTWSGRRRTKATFGRGTTRANYHKSNKWANASNGSREMVKVPKNGSRKKMNYENIGNVLDADLGASLLKHSRGSLHPEKRKM